jgi:hypothetical protein
MPYMAATGPPRSDIGILRPPIGVASVLQSRENETDFELQ